MEFRKVRFAAAIFHIRWRLAWNRFASHARRSRLCTDCACELDAVERILLSRQRIISAFLAGSGILLIVGLWTPIVGALVALLEIWKILTIAGDRWVTVLLGTLAALSQC